MFDLREFRSPKAPAPSVFRFAVAANALAGHPRVSRNFPGARSASFQGTRSYIPLACDDTFPKR